MTGSRLRLYLVADPDLVDGDLALVVSSAISGGVTAIQLRVKHGADCEFEALGRKIGAICRGSTTLFLINDRVDIALAVGADGVHLGVDDLSIEAARKLGGEGFLIGYSPETDEQAAAAGQRGADYLGVGPVYGTSSKHDAGDAIGLGTLTRRIHLSGVPTVGIGGIARGNAAAVLAAGTVGVAVMSSILRSDDPASAARALSVEIAE